jgi:hypothetical protein
MIILEYILFNSFYFFFTGTVIVTRGRYLTPKEKNQASSERSLHLLIKGPKKQNLDRKNIF